jgi:chromosomal replication initiator protein
MTNNTNLWETALLKIEQETTEASFKTWFKDSILLKQEDGVIYIGVATRIMRDWLQDKYYKTILKTLRDIDPELRNVEFTVSKMVGKKKKATPVNTSQTSTNPLPIDNLYVDKVDNLNPRYTFDSFVVGPFNQLANAAAQAVLNSPALTYNPLYIYGSTGHGKTHLIQALGNKFKQLYPSKKVFYVSSEKFTVDYTTAVQGGRAKQFKDKYRQYDVLIVDDVQFIADKEKTQEELFHLFNALYDSNKQIIFSSDKHPNSMKGLEDRLRGRFSSGMVTEIPAPDTDSRIAILKEKIAGHNFVLDDKTIEVVAKELRGNIRDIEGIVNNIILTTQSKGRDLRLPEIRAIIQNNMRPTKNITPKDVVNVVADYYSINPAIIYEKTRKKEVVRPRQIIMYILREDVGISYPTIGEQLGGRDHTTVIHSCDRVKKMLEEDYTLQQEIDQIRTIMRD